MEVMQWTQMIVAILTGLAAAIPLVVKLVEYIQKAIKEKNWTKMMNLVINLMEEAEDKLQDGADKKQWVLAMVKASADTIDYTVDLNEVGDFIDKLVDMSRIVNATTEAKK